MNQGAAARRAGEHIDGVQQQEEAPARRERPLRQSPPAFDGVSEIYRNAPTASPEAVAALRAEFVEDEQYFLDIPSSPVFMGEVRVIIG